MIALGWMARVVDGCRRLAGFFGGRGRASHRRGVRGWCASRGGRGLRSVSAPVGRTEVPQRLGLEARLPRRHGIGVGWLLWMIGVLGSGGVAWGEVLTINSVPSGGTVLVNGREQGRTPLRLELQAGRYHVEIRSPRMLTWTSYLILPQNGDIALKATLEGQGTGKTLAEAYRDRKSGDKPLREVEPSEARGGSEGVGSEDAGSLKATGLLQAYSEPMGATVMLEGRKLGETPLLVNLPVGSHTVSFSHEGYFSEEKTVEVKVTKSARVEVKMRPNGRPIPRVQDGSEGTGEAVSGDVQLTILSKPQARVFLNGRDLGQTPLLTAGIAPGTYTLRLEEKGYVTHSRKIVLKEGQALKLDILLVPRSK